MDLKPDQALIEGCTQKLMQAYLAKASGDIMMALRAPDKVGDVRSTVQGHVRWLRKQGLKEKEHLPGLLVGKIMKVMAMRSLVGLVVCSSAPHPTPSAEAKQTQQDKNQKRTSVTCSSVVMSYEPMSLSRRTGDF